MIEPRIGITWRPIPASTVVIRAGYGIYPDTSVYQNIVLQHGAAGAALDEPERAEQRGMPADAGQRLHTRALPSPATRSASIPTSASAMRSSWQLQCSAICRLRCR